MAYVGSDMAGAGDADLCVHIGAVHIYKAAVAVDYIDNLPYLLFKDAVGRRIGNHQPRQVLAGGCGHLLQGIDLGVAVLVKIDCLYVETSHCGRCRVGAVRRRRYQHHLALSLAFCLEIVADGDKAGVFARGAAVGLKAAGVKAGDHSQVVLQFGDDLKGSCHLVRGSVWVYVGDFAPREGQHLGGGVELHSAAAQWNHGVGERDVAPLQALYVAHHSGLAMVQAEYGLGQEVALAGHKAAGGGCVHDLYLENLAEP